MRHIFLLFCLALLSGSALLYLVQLEQGYILISLGKTTLEMSFWVGLFALLLILFGTWVLYCVTKSGVRSVATGVQRVIYGHSRIVQKRMSQGLIDFIEGNWKQAKKKLLKSVKQSETPLVNYLAAARSAYELGEHKEAHELLHKAEKCGPNNVLAIALTQARMQLLDKKYELCVATLERVKKKVPRHPVILDLLRQSYTALRDWRGLQSLLPTLRRQKVYTEEKMKMIENNLYQALLTDAGEQAKRVSGKQSLQKLEEAWQLIPRVLQRQPEMVEPYVRMLRQHDGDVVAELVLRRMLNKNWSENLVRLYGLVESEDPQKQLLTAKDWLKERPGNASLMLTLGRLCLRNELWGKARDYFESSLRLQRDPETFAELARLLAHLGEHERSTEYYQEGLLMMTNGLPELPMPVIKGKEIINRENPTPAVVAR